MLTGRFMKAIILTGLVLALSVIDTGSDLAAYGGCYCITVDCNGCEACIPEADGCIEMNSSGTRAQFVFPNDCGDYYSRSKLCDANSYIEEAAAACQLDAIVPCNN